jgi:hypothetical protein
MNVKMQFVLTGFTHDIGFRVFTFDRIGEDRERTQCTVRADLALARKYGIQIQELPLLCRGLLDRSEEKGDMQSLVFTEDEMRVCADERAAAHDRAARKKAPHRHLRSATVSSEPGTEPSTSHTKPFWIDPALADGHREETGH